MYHLYKLLVEGIFHKWSILPVKTKHDIGKSKIKSSVKSLLHCIDFWFEWVYLRSDQNIEFGK